MKKLLWSLSLALPLFAFEFDFSLPPVFEETLGEEVQQPKRVQEDRVRPKPIEQKRIYDPEPTTIYVESDDDERIEPSYEMTYASYPKVALLVPKKVIGKYANSIADSILSYMIYKNKRFQFELFDSDNEEENNIVSTLNQIKQKGYQLVVAAVTQKGAQTIVNHEHTLLVYIPTINKKEIDLKSENIFFGGIDYEEQIDKLLTYAGEKVAIFGDKSALSRKLEKYVENASFSDISYRKTIPNAKANLSGLIKKNIKIKDASIFLNMPIVKSSLLASQLNVHGAKHKNILLTQISYNPLLFTLTQAKEREKMYLANSIGRSNFELKDTNLLLGSNLDFSWVNYATVLGLDFMIHNFIDDAFPKEFEEPMVHNQIKYSIDILRPQDASFVKVPSRY